MAPYQLHRRQFLINRQNARPDWRTTPIGGGLSLHAHPDLHHAILTDREGQTWYLLGDAVPAQTDTPITTQVAEAASDEVWALSDGWAGRWVLIGNGQIGLDASGMLGVYYNPQAQEAGSSAALIEHGEATHEISHLMTMNWYAPPASRVQGVRRLLPSQRLDLSTWTPVHRPLLMPLPPRSYAETLDELEVVLRRTVRGMAQLGQVIMPLTAGNDSRLILSLLIAEGQRPDTFTLRHNTRMSVGDQTLPGRIASMLNLKHEVINRPAALVYPNAYEAYHEQAAGHAVEQDQHYIAHGQFDNITDEHVLLHGGGFEVGRQYYGKFPAQRDFSRFEPIAPAAREALREWAAWADLHPESLDWRDRMYMEQRLGGWISACGLGTDMMPGLRLPPANSRYTMSLLLSLPEEVRAQSRHHADLVTRLTPQLAGIPFNPADPLPQRLAQLPGKVFRKVRQFTAR